MNSPRPWSVMVPTFNPSDLLEETLRSALASLKAARIEAQVTVVDDASTAVDVEALLRRWRLDFIPVHRRSVNGGLGACWNTCIERARSEWIHILHQDDMVKPAFYERMSALLAKFPEAGMSFCRTEFLDGRAIRFDRLEQDREGLLDDWLPRICAGQRLQCPAAVVRSRTYREVGGFHTGLRYVVDWEMWVRIAAFAPVAYMPEPLAVYRIHSSAETGRIKSAGRVTHDLAAGLEAIEGTLSRVGRLDCLPAAAAYAVAASAYAAEEAELRHTPAVAALEIWQSLRHFYRFMSWRQRRHLLRSYLRLALRRIERSVALETRL